MIESVASTWFADVVRTTVVSHDGPEVSYDGGVVRHLEVSYDGGVVRHLQVSYDGGVVRHLQPGVVRR